MTYKTNFIFAANAMLAILGASVSYLIWALVSTTPARPDFYIDLFKDKMKPEEVQSLLTGTLQVLNNQLAAVRTLVVIAIFVFVVQGCAWLYVRHKVKVQSDNDRNGGQWSSV